MIKSDDKYSHELTVLALTNCLHVLENLRSGQINMNGPYIDRAIIDSKAALSVCQDSSDNPALIAALAGKAFFEHRHPITSEQPATEPH